MGKVKIFTSRSLWEVLATISVALGLLLLVPFLVEAGTWEQATQADFNQGSTDNPDLEIKKDQVKLVDGVTYEDAEDGDTVGWKVYDNQPPGAVANVLDAGLNSRIIDLTSTDPGDGVGTGFIYPANHLGPYTIQWKARHLSKDFRLYVSVFTTDGHRYLQYKPGKEGVSNNNNKGYLTYEIEGVNDGQWYTITRDLEKDLDKLQPGNKINRVYGFLVRGKTQIDYIAFLSDQSNYTSPVLDLGTHPVASFEKINWSGSNPTGTELNLQTRTSTDGTNWSAWSKKYGKAGEKVQSPPDRYLQYKASFSTETVASVPVLDKVTVEYNRYPNPPATLSPENDKKLTDQDKLKWSQATDVDTEDSLTYVVELDDNAGFQSIDSTTTGVKATEIQISQLDNFQNLSDGIKYHWRVRTVDNHNAQSGYSSVQRIVLDKNNIAPQAPQSGFNPHQGGEVKVLKPTIYWGAASDPDKADSTDKLSYLVQLDDNSKFDSATIFSTQPSVTRLTVPQDLDDNFQYYYRVKTKDDEGAESGWSATQTFVVVTGKNPDIGVAKTVEINENAGSSSGLPYLLGGLGSSSGNFTQYLYSLAALATLIILILLLKGPRRLSAVMSRNNRQLAPRKNSISQLILYDLDSNLPAGDRGVGVATKVKGGRTKTLVAVLLIGGLAAAAAGVVRYYQENPSPYKDDGQEVRVGDELTYRVDYSNKGKAKATNFNIADSIPAGATYIEGSAGFNGNSQTDANDSDAVNYSNNKIKFKLGDILPGSSGYVVFRVKVVNIPEGSKVINVADVVFSESAGVQASNQVTNPVQEETTSLATSTIKGIVWYDNNGDKNKDQDEKGVEQVKIKLYQDTDDSGSLETSSDTLTKEVETDSSGRYVYNNLSADTYIVQLEKSTLPATDSTVTTDNNPQIIKIEEGQEYSNIDFGVSLAEDALIESEPTGKIRGLVWEDGSQNGSRDADESGLVGVKVKLYEDSNDNEALDEDSDFYVTTSTTDANGDYSFGGLSAKRYLVVSSVPAGYQLTTSASAKVVELASDDQAKDGVNFGYFAASPEITETEEEGVKTVTTTTTSDYYGGTPTVITSSQEESKPDTVAVTPLEVLSETEEDQVSPPTITHIGSARVDDFSKKYSVDLGEDLALRGKTGAGHKVTIFIHSEINLKTTTTADKDGIWEVAVNPQTFEPGEHKVLAQSQDLEGDLSEKVEIARFVVNSAEKQSGTTKTDSTTLYWIALLALLVVATTVVAVTWIREGKEN